MRLPTRHQSTFPFGIPRTQPTDPPVESDSLREITAIRANLLIPGRGDPITNAAVVIKGDKIAWVGKYAEIPSWARGARPPTHVSVLMPGLWDCHVHFMGGDVMAGVATFSSYLPGTNALCGALIVDSLRDTLMAGYTSVRELGGYGGDVWPGVQVGHLVGPNVYSSISAISITGGHGDDHASHLDTVLQNMASGGPVAIADGADECTKTVRELIRRGARCIKICSTGGVLSIRDDPEDQQFCEAEITAMVQEAARSRRSVAAHAIGKAGIMSALNAGVKSIEHGMYIDEEVADLIIEKDAVFVPTHHIVETLTSRYDEIPEPTRSKLLKLRDLARKSYKLCVQKGVKIALGTDTLASKKGDELVHGNNARELYWAVEMGMTPLQAIEASTANAPDVLGRMAPLSGQLKVGYDADLIAVAKNPLQDIEVLNKVENITHVWKGGSLYKSPRRPQ